MEEVGAQKGRTRRLSKKPSSSIVHREDGGLVYSSIQNDGTILHWCDKCGRIWVSREKPEGKVSSRVMTQSEMEEATAFIAEYYESAR